MKAKLAAKATQQLRTRCAMAESLNMMLLTHWHRSVPTQPHIFGHTDAPLCTERLRYALMNIDSSGPRLVYCTCALHLRTHVAINFWHTSSNLGIDRQCAQVEVISIVVGAAVGMCIACCDWHGLAFSAHLHMHPACLWTQQPVRQEQGSCLPRKPKGQQKYNGERKWFAFSG